MRDVTSAYPLQWPMGWKRTEPSKRKEGRFHNGKGGFSSHDISIWDGVRRIWAEFRAMGVSLDGVVISTNVETRNDGVPRSDRRAPDDPGVAVYWTGKNGVQQCMAIDTYTSVAQNLGAVAATLDGMRTIERHGGAEVTNHAYSGFKALPDVGGSSAPRWQDVFGLAKGTPTFDDVRLQYRALAKQHHPDAGGDPGAWATIQRAYDTARQEFGL